jgi:hypothetical protein
MLFMTRSPDEMVRELRDLEAESTRIRLRQAVLVNELDKANIAGAGGHRSMQDWVSGTLDVSRGAARDLVAAARLLGKHRRVNFRLAAGNVTFDRGLATMRLAAAGADPGTVQHSEGLDLDGVARLTARQRRVTRRDERAWFADRYLTVQPTLDESAYRISGMLPGTDGRIVEEALYERADEIRHLPGGDATTGGQRRADALVAMAMDSRSRNRNDERIPSGPRVNVFVDLERANTTGGETGCAVEYGPRVGPDTLEELLCTGTVRIVGLEAGTPVVTSNTTRAIPPAVRNYVTHRDGACTIAGCTSRYRLEPHHITPRSRGGTHDPDNLTTLCWYHHHIAIHRNGFHIDPHSPPGRRRLTRIPRGPDPPRPR